MRRGSNSLNATLSLNKIKLHKEELTDAEYKQVLNVFRNNLDSKEFAQFNQELDIALRFNANFNNQLSNAYYNEKYYSVFILYAFTVVLPFLINAAIPNNIALFVKLALNFFNLQLLNYYYRIFVDPSNPEIRKLQSGVQLRLTNATELYIHAYKVSQNAENFENKAYIIMDGLMKIKQEVEEFSNKYTNLNTRVKFRFVYFYLAIFIVMLYIAICFDRNELKNMFEKLNTILSPSRQTTMQPLLNQTPRIVTVGGKKVKKPKISTKPKKKTIV